MRLAKLLFLLTCVAFLGACSCTIKRAGSGNIPVAGEGSILKDVHFAFDRYDLSADAQMILKTNSEWLKANSGARVEIEGHCDERGTNEYNMALGMRRARAVEEYLQSLGIGADRMRTVSYGEELPLDPRHNEEAWAKNRRAHFNILR